MSGTLKAVIIIVGIICFTVLLSIETMTIQQRKTAISIECIKQGMQWSNWNSECKK